VTQRRLPLEQALGWKATWSGARRSPGVRRRSSSGGPGARHEHVPTRHAQEDPHPEIPGQPRPSETYRSEEIPRRRGTSAAPCRGGRVGRDLRGLVRARTRGGRRKLASRSRSIGRSRRSGGQPDSRASEQRPHDRDPRRRSSEGERRPRRQRCDGPRGCQHSPRRRSRDSGPGRPRRTATGNRCLAANACRSPGDESATAGAAERRATSVQRRILGRWGSRHDRDTRSWQIVRHLGLSSCP
jgi:hypothetical protein